MPPRVGVAASGGRDSTALLHATARAAVPLGIRVVALHVHHGLMPEADAWLERVRALAARLGAGFDSRRLDGAPAAGQSMEAWARAGRYDALAEMARAADCGLVLLAHHRLDQAETFLLQALRGGGARGLAAMPDKVDRNGLVWARPWLRQPGASIQAYVAQHRLPYADDASNADPRYARSRLRLSVWPALSADFPAAEQTLSAACRRSAESVRLADEVAATDLPPLLRGAALDVPAWQRLTPARRRNALQAWLHSRLSASRVPDSLVQRLMNELGACAGGRWPAPGAELRLYRGMLTADRQPSRTADAALTERPGHDPTFDERRLCTTPASGPAQTVCIDLSRPGRVWLAGWSGEMCSALTDRGGAPPALLTSLSVRPRSGGERFRLTVSGSARSLKKQCQSQAVAAWLRHGPLLFAADGRLVYAPGLGIDAASQAPAGAHQLSITWHPADPSTGPATGQRG